MTRLIPLAHYLNEKKRQALGAGAVSAPPAPAPNTPSPSSEDLAQIQQKWYAMGYEAGQQLAQKEAEQAIRALKDDHMRALAQQRLEWAERESKPLARAVIEAFDALESKIAASTATVLEPFIKQQAMNLALEELCQMIRATITNHKKIHLKIVGAEDLVAKVRAELQGVEIVHAAVSEGLSVKVEVGDTVIETNVDAWFEKLKEFSRA